MRQCSHAKCAKVCTLVSRRRRYPSPRMKPGIRSSSNL